MFPVVVGDTIIGGVGSHGVFHLCVVGEALNGGFQLGFGKTWFDAKLHPQPEQ